MNYKPSIYAKDIFHINYDILRQNGIKCLLFDIDNTIARVDERYPSPEVINLFNKLKKDFKIIIITNAIRIRANRFKSYLNVSCLPFACKPLKKAYRKILKEYSYKETEIAAIGDQLYTDIKGANKMNIKSILIDQISAKESIITKYNRYKENKLISKTQIIKRGEYYD
ncbi:MAG TPA: YqeG family HAD IIIA-type phosphatase [Firmicutes bacterium]|nr:YqeG family HAD IIIA-type phosphatase [Bacillota bacterium]